MDPDPRLKNIETYSLQGLDDAYTEIEKCLNGLAIHSTASLTASLDIILNGAVRLPMYSSLLQYTPLEDPVVESHSSIAHSLTMQTQEVDLAQLSPLYPSASNAWPMSTSSGAPIYAWYTVERSSGLWMQSVAREQPKEQSCISCTVQATYQTAIPEPTACMSHSVTDVCLYHSTCCSATTDWCSS
jgi:hypothetical protein